MLKQACMLLGPHYCHRVISVLWVGDTLVFVTLGTVGVCEILIVWFLIRAWRTRGPTTARSARVHVSLGPPARSLVIDGGLEHLAATAFHPTLPLAPAGEALT